MEIIGNVVEILPITSGVSAAGKAWKNIDIVIEVPSQYPTYICFNIFGDKAETHGMKIGDNVEVSVNIESKKFKDRYFTQIKAWKWNVLSSNNQDTEQQSNNQSQGYNESLPPVSTFTEDESDDLPF